MLNKFVLSAATACLFCLSGCGRYAPPVSPERVAPQAVRDVAATATENSLILTWATPETDRRGKDLKSIDGFSVYRKDIVTTKDAANDEIEFTLLSESTDKAIAEREGRKQEARNIGAISRRVKIDPELAKQRYEDKEVARGKSYLYKIVPTNQGGVEGEVRDFISVTFRGLESDISVVTAKRLGLDDGLAPAEGEIVSQ